MLLKANTSFGAKRITRAGALTSSKRQQVYPVTLCAQAYRRRWCLPKVLPIYKFYVNEKRDAAQYSENVKFDKDNFQCLLDIYIHRIVKKFLILCEYLLHKRH